MATKSVSIAVFDSQPLYRDALIRLFSEPPGMSVVGSALPGKDAIALTEREHPDVCVIDYDFPEREGLALLRALSAVEPAPGILVMIGKPQLEQTYAMIEAGAAGALLKSSDGEEILRAVNRIAGGEDVLAPDIQTSITQHIREQARTLRVALTDREIEVLTHTAQGKSAHEIGEDLNLAESTVKTHLTRIYDKLGVSERAAAVAEAMRRGLIS